jgi:hypothetical protein
MSAEKKSNPGGRPPKFGEPRRPVTMTLPVRILEQLAVINPDRTLAVVKATEAVMGSSGKQFKLVELVQMAPGKSLIVVGSSLALRQISWLRLIEIAPARYLLTIPSGTPIEALEVALRDLAHDPEQVKNQRETQVLDDLLQLIGQHRRSMRLSKAELLIIDTD